ncbi:MAG TPA: response regulator transcription factor [Terriglobales bacterium]|nr:response regulator transcription factor [Terriglobales bacterium]
MSVPEQRTADHRRVLIVDDEPQITRVLRTSLDAHAFDVRVANDGDTALQIAHDWPPDLMITDLSMPVMDGLELCRRFRQKSNAPIIVLSVKGEERTKVQALDAGADDYVTKPFGINELLARVRANLRRAPQEETQGGVIEEGDFHIDLDAHTATVRGRELKLTPKEFDLLAFFAQNPRKVITHRKLLGAVWGATSTEQPEYLRVFVGQLRKKIEAGSDSRSYILTEPWVGYRFEPEGTLQH